MNDNNVDIDAYHDGSVFGNHCMYFGANGDKILDSMKKALLPKIKHADHARYLADTYLRMKYILKLWYGLMRTMKSVVFQTDDDCKKFEENTIDLGKALYSLIIDPPRSRMWIKTFQTVKKPPIV